MGWDRNAAALPTRAAPCLGGGEHVRLRPVNANGDLSTGGTELLEEAPVGADPQVVLCDLHLGMNSNCLQNQNSAQMHRCQPQSATNRPGAGHVGVALRDTAEWWTWQHWPRVGLGDLKGLFQPKRLSDFITLVLFAVLRLPMYDTESNVLPCSTPFCLSQRASHPTAPTHMPCSSTYRTEVARTWCSVKAQQQPGDGDHVVLDKRLQEGRKCQPQYVPAGSRAPRAPPTW